jgi:hypothetical protein
MIGGFTQRTLRRRGNAEKKMVAAGGRLGKFFGVSPTLFME